MSRVAYLMMVICLASTPLSAQINDCGDINENGIEYEIADLAFALSELAGGAPVPPDKGDVDSRQGYNIGDLRYMLGVIFGQYLPLGCPPFSPYPLLSTADTLILPVGAVPPGTGQIALPLTLVTQSESADMVLPFSVSSSEPVASLDSLVLGPALQGQISAEYWQRDLTSGVISFVLFDTVLAPGSHLIGTAYLTYTSATGGTIALDTASFSDHIFLNYVYGDYGTGDYFDLEVGIPTVAWQPELPNACADINDNGLEYELADVVIAMNEYAGGAPVPPDKGDVDTRQGYNAGDLRYMLGVINGDYLPLGCPPFPLYTLQSTDDTLVLQDMGLPPGSGQIALPVTMVIHEDVADMVLPFTVNSFETIFSLDSLVLGPELLGQNAAAAWQRDQSTGVISFFLFDRVLAPGSHLIATAYFSYDAPVGGYIAMDTAHFSDHIFLNYVHGDYGTGDYFDLDIGIPTVTVGGAVAIADTLFVRADPAGCVGESMELSIDLKTTHPVAGVQIPVRLIPCSALLDSVSFVGTAVEHWDLKQVSDDTCTLFIGLVADISGGGAPPLPAGTHTLVRLFFRGALLCEVDSIGSYWPTVCIDTADLGLDHAPLVVDDQDPPNEYTPVFVPGCGAERHYRGGDLNCNCAVNTTDIVGLVNCVFKSGSCGCRPFADALPADCDGDCALGSLDIIWLVNYVFRNGPEPVCATCP